MTVREIRHERLRPTPVPLTASKAKHSALLLLNWQPALLAPEGILQRKARETDTDLTYFDRAAASALRRLTVDVLPACRANGVDIVHAPSTYWHRIDSCREKQEAASFGAGRQQALEITGALQGESEELNIRSTSISPFNSTQLDLVLRNLQVDQVLIAGLLTNQSVELTAQDSRDRGYEVIVIEDACAALTDDLHHSAIGRMRSSAIATAPAALVAEQIRSGQAWPETVTNRSVATHPILARDPWPAITNSADLNGNLASPALITVDVQHLNAHPDWGVGRELREEGSTLLDEYFDSVCSILPTVRAIQDAFREARLPLIHLRTACRLSDQGDSGRYRQRNRDPMAALGSKETEFLPQVAPKDSEIVINKTSWGVFNSTDIERVLCQLSARHIVLVGVVTNGCVELAARDALDRGFQVTIVRDATTTRSADLHLDALARLEACGATVQKSTSLLTRLVDCPD